MYLQSNIETCSRIVVVEKHKNITYLCERACVRARARPRLKSDQMKTPLNKLATNKYFTNKGQTENRLK